MTMESLEKRYISFLFSMAADPTPNNILGPTPALRKHFRLKVQVCRRSAGPPLARGPIGSNRINRLKAGPTPA